MPSPSLRPTLRLRKNLRRYIARPGLQRSFRLLYRIALAGMNYGGAGSNVSAGDEIALRRVAAARRETRATPVVFDVGANIGSYVAQILGVLGDDVTVHAFEPSSAAFSRLRETFAQRPNVHLVQAGIGRVRGPATLWSAVPGSVLASTYVNPVDGELPGERIQLVTLDDFCEEHDIRRIDLLKLDLEGGELDALRGASRLLQAAAIEMIQFEFGQPSLGSRTLFVDLFELLKDRFDLYRVLPQGLEPLPEYHETLEVFMSTNYLAIARKHRRRGESRR